MIANPKTAERAPDLVRYSIGFPVVFLRIFSGVFRCFYVVFYPMTNRLGL